MKIKNWDKLTITLLCISGVIILFSFISPYIFTQFTSSIDFTDTGQIGDTFGGIINPFIALSGIILTFLAFYMQIKANQIQVEQFNQTIKNEKDLRLYNDRYNSYHHISLLLTDLEYIINDINEKNIKIKEFIELESQDNLVVNTLFRTPSTHYSKILNIDRLEIYKGFSFFIEYDKEEQLKTYNTLYNLLNFIPEFFKSIYDNYEKYSSNFINTKYIIRNDLNILLDDASQIINLHYNQSKLSPKSELDYLEKPEVQICNGLIKRYYEIIDESYNNNLNIIQETDFNKLSELLKLFIIDALHIRKNIANYDRSIEKLIEKASFIRKNIYDAKQQKNIFVNSLKDEYNKFIEPDKGTLANLKSTKEKIALSLQQFDINKL
ncbi:hypothetical protein [Chryseobacterium sp. 3008163]|uniref:hypothetical protein n=1 Tax=Chryseobacterium sp. 3008163 TaxID=2478663 RepID=UPI000F0C02E0|nr:hypothetical protein [Chryseobacterium sp. 3008163]AYM99897.1 hypothetical protein EAG08_05695 [Chryseobacterium sp. 3008163]